MDNFVNTLAISIRGASHIKSDKPMQDFSLSVKNDSLSIAVVCDGHGADKHFRSEIGSKLAAKVTKDKLAEFFSLYSTWASFSENTQNKLDRLKCAIIASWQKEIEDYTDENPFTEDELKKASPSFAERSKYDIAQPYGTTILAAMICEEYYLVMMIGDGAIVKIHPDFSAEIVSFPGKNIFEDQPHSATDSICEVDSFNKIFFTYQEIGKEPDIAFALCSDGMSEAFSADSALLSKINNYLNYYAEEGYEKAYSAISSQLNELSKISPMKDDISLAFATNSLEKYDKRSQASDENCDNISAENNADNEYVGQEEQPTNN